MTNDEHTITSPLAFSTTETSPLICLTLIWHPEPAMVGRQFLVVESSVEVSRYEPLFAGHKQPPLSLSSKSISRSPMKLVRTEMGELRVIPSCGRMVTEINGKEVNDTVTFSRAEVESGIQVFLARTVLISVKWSYQFPRYNPVQGFIGVSQAAQKARDLIYEVAGMDEPVLLLGETGTGKEVAARAIHQLGPRRQKNMISVNMASLGEGLAAADLFGAAKGAYTGAQTNRIGFFAAAGQSTLFLDEIGNTPAVVQPMLLRVLETGDYCPLGSSQDQRSTVRLIAATDQNLYGTSFNQALLRRLEGLVIHLPPLRERAEDIGLLLLDLINKHLQAGGQAIHLPPALVNQLAQYHWPGNVRQLVQVFKRIVLLSRLGEIPEFSLLVKEQRMEQTDLQSAITIDTIKPKPVEKPNAPRKRLASLTEEDVLKAMEKNDWYIQAAAKALGISRPSMYQLLKMHSVIRRPESILDSEIQQALSDSKGNIETAASYLKTPAEALRRFLVAKVKVKLHC